MHEITWNEWELKNMKRDHPYVEGRIKKNDDFV